MYMYIYIYYNYVVNREFVKNFKLSLLPCTVFKRESN